MKQTNYVFPNSDLPVSMNRDDNKSVSKQSSQNDDSEDESLEDERKGVLPLLIGRDCRRQR